MPTSPRRVHVRYLTAGLGFALAGASVVVGPQAAGAAAPLPAHCNSAPDGSVTCRYINDTMSEQVFTVPVGVSSVHVTASGAPGGDSALAKGGRGATVEADLAVRPGQALYIVVGDYGANRQDGQGGMNGGGAAGSSAAGGGGGAASIRSSSMGEPDPLAYSLVVAGGGGGAGTTYAGGDAGTAGGGGGGGGAGTTTAGGAGGTGTPHGTPGAIGQGGNGAHTDGEDGGGGGGGLFGGGGGGVTYGGGGAGGGANLVPEGGTATAVDTGPAVTIVYTPDGSPWGSLGNLFGSS